MAITQAVCTSFKGELLVGTHNFTATTGDTFKIALYSSSASLDATTTAYSSSNEVSNSGTYTATGGSLTSVTPTTSGTTALCDFADISFTSATITARGALIYNSTDSNKAVAVLDFGGDKTSTSGTFTIQFPAADASNAILRLAQEQLMALVLNDRVKETSTTTGTGTLNLSGAVSGFETFVAGIADGNTTYYAIVNRDEDEWEVGLGTVTDASTDTLARTTVISSSNSDSATDFSAGTKDVFCTLPASKAVFEDASSDVTLPNDLILGSDSAVLKFGADSDTTLTHTDGTGLTLNSTNKLLFRDTGLYIYSSTDGQLDLVADTEIQIAATTIDINGAIALNGAITGATNITLSGELDAATLDVSGNADIDGTLEADAYTVDGTSLAEFIADTTGAMVGSNTETGITVTYQDSDNTIDFALSAAQTTITSLLATDIKIGEDDQTKIDFETADEIHFFAANVEQVYLADNIFGPQSDSDVDLGTTGVRWKDAYIDTITTTGTITASGIITGTGFTAGSAVLAESELELLDGLTAGTAIASKVVTTDASIDTTGQRNLTISGELDAASLDISGDADIDGTLEADAITIGSTAIGSIYGVIAGSSSIVTTGALDTGSITSGFGAIDNGTSGIRTNTFTAETSLVPDASGGADIGTTSLEWGDFYIADDKYIQFGSDQNVLVGYDETTTDSLKIAATEGAGLAITLMADEGDDAGDEWKLNIADGGTITLGNDINSAGTFVTHFTLAPNSTVTSSLATFAGEVQMVTLDIGGTNVSATAAEINYSDLATLGTSAASKVLSADANNLTKITGGVYLEEDTLSFDATQDWDVRASPVAQVTLTANVTFDLPSNPTTGQYISILCIQDGTGSRTISWNAAFEFTGGTAPTATTTAGKGDLFTFRYHNSHWIEVGRNLNLTRAQEIQNVCSSNRWKYNKFSKRK